MRFFAGEPLGFVRHETPNLSDSYFAVEGKKRDAARFSVISYWLSVNWEMAKLARI